jgi:hypothetical protein
MSMALNRKDFASQQKKDFSFAGNSNLAKF